MWRRKCGFLLNQSLSTTVVGHGFQLTNPSVVPSPSLLHPSRLMGRPKAFAGQECGIATRSSCFITLLSVGLIKRFSSSWSTSSSPLPSDSNSKSNDGDEARPIGKAEAKRLVDVEDLKAKLEAERKEVISYHELFETCESIRVARSSDEAEAISLREAKRLMRLVDVELLFSKLGAEGKEVISYDELVEACKSIGIARSSGEAAAFVRILDEAGRVFLFRDKVYLNPDKVVDCIRRADPLDLTPEDDSVKEELKRLQEKKEEIDVLAHKQVRRILVSGMVLALLQVGLFFRLTFWEFSWDVMEPVAFFTTMVSLVISYGYFLMTSRDPTYQDLMKRLFLNRQRKLLKKYNFDCTRFKELQRKLKIPHDATASIKNRFGLELDLEDALHKD